MQPYIKAVQSPVQKLPEVTTIKRLYHMESILSAGGTQRATTAWYKLKSRVFPGLFLETLSRASSAKDLSHKSVSTRQ